MRKKNTRDPKSITADQNWVRPKVNDRVRGPYLCVRTVSKLRRYMLINTFGRYLRSFIRTFEGTKVIIKNLPGTDRANSFKSDYEGPFPGASA